jgi:hypothetical protein
MDSILTVICVAVLIWVGLGRGARSRVARRSPAPPEDLRELIHAASSWRRAAR